MLKKGNGEVDLRTKCVYSPFLERGYFDCHAISADSIIHMSRQPFRRNIGDIPYRLAHFEIVKDAHCLAEKLLSSGFNKVICDGKELEYSVEAIDGEFKILFNDLKRAFPSGLSL